MGVEASGERQAVRVRPTLTPGAYSARLTVRAAPEMSCPTPSTVLQAAREKSEPTNTNNATKRANISTSSVQKSLDQTFPVTEPPSRKSTFAGGAAFPRAAPPRQPDIVRQIAPDWRRIWPPATRCRAGPTSPLTSPLSSPLSSPLTSPLSSPAKFAGCTRQAPGSAHRDACDRTLPQFPRPAAMAAGEAMATMALVGTPSGCANPPTRLSAS